MFGARRIYEPAPLDRDAHETLPLSKAAEHLLGECRMVLPGIQALLGFQLISFFSPGFDRKLALVDPCVTVTLAGTLASERSSLDSETRTSPAGAAFENVTSPVTGCHRRPRKE